MTRTPAQFAAAVLREMQPFIEQIVRDEIRTYAHEAVVDALEYERRRRGPWRRIRKLAR